MKTEKFNGFDVLVVGGGPAGLSADCRIMQRDPRREKEISVCLVGEGLEIGAHILFWRCY